MAFFEGLERRQRRAARRNAVPRGGGRAVLVHRGQTGARGHPACHEDPVADTLGPLRRVRADLGIPAVGEYPWASVPEEGTGRACRRGHPCGRGEDLTPGRGRMIRETAAPFLEGFYAGQGRGRG